MISKTVIKEYNEPRYIITKDNNYQHVVDTHSGSNGTQISPHPLDYPLEPEVEKMNDEYRKHLENHFGDELKQYRIEQ